jgi:diguanylate cyclase (GGDEF)-like protein/PAS domain S-box-containing protein
MFSDEEAGGASPTSPAGPPVPSVHLPRDYPELLQRVPAVVYIADAGDAGRWHYVSPQILTILGFSAEEWCAEPELWANRLHPDDRDQVIASEPRESHGTAEPSAVEYRLLHRDGHVVWIRDDASLVRDHDGCLRWHGVLSDITARKRVEAELEQRAAQQTAVALFGEKALEGATTSELMNEAALVAVQTLGVEIGGVAEMMAEEGCLVLRAGHGWPESAIGDARLPGGEGSQTGFTILSGKPVAVSDWDEPKPFGQSPILRELGVRSGLSVVIEGSTGPFGVLAVHSFAPRDYGAGDVDFLQALANVLADALERQAIEDDIRHRALHDTLTGLPNRALFLDRLDQALARLRRHGSMAAILFLDLDHFKLVNDSLGHHVGDELLAAAAPRIRQAMRSTDTVARFGGDEFGIVLEDIRDERHATEMAQRIAAAFTRPFVLAGNEHFVTASVGIALAHGGELPEELIREADAAMYRAKERGRARYELFDEVMRGRALARLRVENDLRTALERGELRLDYQPLVSLSDRSLKGVEALVRWEHPERGLVMPSDFILIAEEAGLIEPIGRWVLEEACRQAGRWYRSRADAAPIGMSVNLSAAQLSRGDLPDLVASALRSSGLDPACLSLELKEAVLLGDLDVLSEALGALKATGVRLVLDDFGTGFSSLVYLTRLPLDGLKFDRAFVDGLGTEGRDTGITEAIIAMARALSLEVIAEGVETEQQANALVGRGCELAQGFFFSRAVSARTISSMLRSGPVWLARGEPER